LLVAFITGEAAVYFVEGELGEDCNAVETFLAVG